MSALGWLLVAALAASPRTPKRTPEESASSFAFLAPKVGLFKSTTRLSGDLFMGLEVGYLLPVLQRRLALVAEVNYHRPEHTGTLDDPRLSASSDHRYTLAEREVGLLVSAVFRFDEAWGPITPYVGAGPGLYLHRATVEVLGETASESGGRWGLQLLGGAEVTVGPGGLFVETQYHLAPLHFLTTGDVNVGGFLAASLGYRIRL
ncbi:outer membrane beta-barrel protein [Myxococcaceae bacterium JPH2]|nr:outer membrane beta-barrel protein [Myxococcaceae bacterium JPH2]